MKSYLFYSLILVTGLAFGQKKGTPAPTPIKKSLSHEVYDSWKEINYKALTPDGAYAAFTVNPQDGDGKVIFYNLKNNHQDSVKRAAEIALTYDSRYALFKIRPEQNKVKELRRQKKKKEDLPKDSLGIYSFASRKTEKVPDVKSFKVPEKAGGIVAFQLEAKKEAKPAPGKPDEKKPASSKKKKANTDDNGYTLIVKRLPEGKELTFGYVKDYTFAKYGQGLLFCTTGNDSTLSAGMYWYDLQKDELLTIHRGKSKYNYKGLSISEDGSQLAFLVDKDTTKALVRHYQLHYWKQENTETFIDIEKSSAIPQDWIVSEYYTPLFSKDGSKLYFGSTPQPVVQDTTLLTEEIVNVEIWRSDDDYIYPQQNKRLEAEKKRNYLVRLDLANKTITQIGTPDVPSIELGNEGNASVFLGESNVPYRKQITWEGSGTNDFYVFNAASRTKKQIALGIKGNASLSPKANYIYWFHAADTAWFSYSIAADKSVNLTKSVKVKFADEEDDHPDYPTMYGAAGWTADDQLFIAYDRYDLWAFDPLNNKPPVNLTKVGRQEKTVFRYVKLDPEERFLDPTKELLLSAFNETTKASGYYKLSLQDGKLTKLIMDNFRFGGTVKAKLANQLLFTKESFREFPDVWTSDLNLNTPKKISNANPQMKNYLWGSVELVNWTSLDNIPLTGLLYKPENFDPRKKYPMIVNFYERNSDNLHAHNAPFPHRSTINQTVYTSDGYLVFIPDIVYKIGFPGESALNCILPGVTSLISKGFVDDKNIGIQGHSWGGYQISYLVTRTNMFKAAEAGAVVANMISAYGGIRWESGLSRMFQYEHTQSRIGGSLWEKPLYYIENSPIFFADKIQTPLLLLHNDADGAVPWYQGIEMYMAMRRLNKPVWMLNYNGEPHWPLKRENRIDFQIRMKQFFDHYLKATEMAPWMKEGIPAIEKGITKGY